MQVDREPRKPDTDKSFATGAACAERQAPVDTIRAAAEGPAHMSLLQRSHQFLLALLRDLRFAIRSIYKDGRFAVLAMIALALGIGAATVIFSVIYGVILNTFPFPNSDRITSFAIHDVRRAGRGGREYLLLPEFLDLREQNHVFEDISGVFGGFGNTPLVYQAADAAYEFNVSYLTANSFKFFGMDPVVGRLITPDDGKPGAPPVFLMSHRLWRQQFNEDRSIVGKTFLLGGVQRTLVGIMPPRFRWSWADAWLPISLDRSVIAAEPEFANAQVWPVGRLKPGVSLEQAAADLDVVTHQIAKTYPRRYPDKFSVTAMSLADRVLGPFKDLIYPLTAAVLMLMFIACTNVANLLLARATVREREIAVRAAMGGSRGRLVQQFLVESFVLAAIACVLGCLLAIVGIKFLVPLFPYNVFPQEAIVTPNSSVLLFAVVATLVTTLVCGLAPALFALRGQLYGRLAGTAPGAGAGFRHGRLRSTLLIAEVALSMVLLVGAAVMIRTFFNLTHVDLGFSADNVVTVRVPPPRTRANDPYNRVVDPLLFKQIVQRISGLPGALAASPTVMMPPRIAAGGSISIPGRVHKEQWVAGYDLVSEGYFSTLGMRLLRGRVLTAVDVEGERRVAVVNDTFVQKFFGNDNPIGRTVIIHNLSYASAATRKPGSNATDEAPFEIIGVVADAKNSGLNQPVFPEAFLPYTSVPFAAGTILVRTNLAPDSMVASIRQATYSVSPSTALTDVGTLKSFLHRDYYANPEFQLVVMTAFAGIGLILVIIGVFSVIAYSVSLQTHTIGVRMALGAQPGHILRMVLKSAFILVSIGIAIGLLVSIALTRVVASQVLGVKAIPSLMLVVVAAVVLIIGLGASYVPARRAAKVDPMTAIRYE